MDMSFECSLSEQINDFFLNFDTIDEYNIDMSPINQLTTKPRKTKPVNKTTHAQVRGRPQKKPRKLKKVQMDLPESARRQLLAHNNRQYAISHRRRTSQKLKDVYAEATLYTKQYELLKERSDKLNSEIAKLQMWIQSIMLTQTQPQ
jgi:hypothetical protein